MATPRTWSPNAAPRKSKPKPEVFTVGHSTRPIEEFLAILSSHGIQTLVDVRTIPKSLHNPQFGSKELAKSLKNAGISYIWRKGLGGLRKTKPDSVNGAWKNASFRGYADYMQTPEFEKELDALIELAQESRVAVMCAEAVPWRCHRNLIADALTAKKIPVEHLMGVDKKTRHALTKFAQVTSGHVTYPKSTEPTLF